ncbi:MAG TPA: RsmE family RNA methyltransferase [Candidatus Paceibacterota bacterium]
MRFHRFYVDRPISEETFDIVDANLIHQWRDVFRYNVGGRVILFDGSGTDFICMITSLRNLGATVSVVQKMENIQKPKRSLWLCVGIVKKDNFELVVQKATELGVTHIIPLLCERTEKKNINMDRLHKIAIESSEQSGRADLPVIHDIRTLSELFKEMILPREKFVLNFDGKYIGDISPTVPSELAVFIGPEGGWSDREMKEFVLQNIQAVSLGTQVLRAETASVAVSSLLLL